MVAPIMANRLDTDVLIVGAGPTGLALATMLMRSGITPVIVDKLTTGQNTSRAAVVHAHTLEVLEQLGVSDRLAHKGLKLAKFSIRDRDRVLVQLRFDTLPTRHAYLLMLPQDMTEKILAEGLAEAGGALRRGCTVEALVETPEGIQASVVSGEGQTDDPRTVFGRGRRHAQSGAADRRDRICGCQLRGIVRLGRRGDDVGSRP